MENRLSEEEKKILQSSSDRRDIRIIVVKNGYVFNSRSGRYVYDTRSSLMKAIGAYLDVIEKEVRDENSSATETH